MKPSKPLTTDKKNKCRQVLKMLQERDIVYKEEIIAELHLTNERTARDLIAEIAKYKPIISTSDSKGYRLAKTLRDLEDVEHAWAELDSRQAEIESRKLPLIKFREAAIAKQIEISKRAAANGNI